MAGRILGPPQLTLTTPTEGWRPHAAARAFSGWGRRAKGQPVIELFPAANLMGAKIEFERSFDDGEIFYNCRCHR